MTEYSEYDIISLRKYLSIRGIRVYMVQVSSKNLGYVGYDEKLKLLQIQFVNGKIVNGKTYEYYDVPKNIYIGLISASSANDYFVEYVRDVYRYSRI